MNSNDVDIFLEHHGVKGMKWGVRKKEDLTGKAKNKKEEVASFVENKKKELKERNTRINAERKATLNARIAKTDVRLKEIDERLNAPGAKKYSYESRNLRYEKSLLKEQRAKDVKSSENTSSGSGLTSGQKKVLVGAGVAVGLVATYGAYRVLGTESGRASLRSAGSRLRYGSEFKKDPSLAQASSVSDVMSKVVPGINPNYDRYGGQMNCRRCTFAYELRRRGYDVEATTAALGRGQNETGLVNALVKGDKNIRGASSMSANASWNNPLGIRARNAGDTRVDDAIRDTVTNFISPQAAADSIRSTLLKHPNGARGEIVFDERAFAHSLQWEIFDGVPHMFDAQKAQHFPVTEEGLSKFIDKWGNPELAEITRLDNLDLDLAFLSQWAKNT